MVKIVLNWGKSILSGFKNESKRLLIELQFDQKIEGQKSLKAELHRVTKVTKEGSSKAIRYVLYVNSEYFGSRLVVVCSPKEWLKATKSNFSSSFTVHCELDDQLISASATISEFVDESEILPVAQCA